MSKEEFVMVRGKNTHKVTFEGVIIKKLNFVSIMLAVVLALSLSLVSCGNGTTDDSGVQYNKVIYVESNPDKGFNYGYYYYIPRSIRNKSKKYLFVEPNNSPSSSDDMAFHYEYALRAMNRAEQYADEIVCIALVPVFPRPQSYPLMYTHDLNRLTLLNKTGLLARIDLQLIQMIEDLREKCLSTGIKLESKFLMDGYSASGSFVNRFTLIHPELVQAAAAGGMIPPTLPIETLEGERLIFTVGIADLKEITGTPFNLEQYITVPQFLYWGRADDNDPLPTADCYGNDERRIIIKILGCDMNERMEKSKRIFEEQGCSAVTFIGYEGVGHTITNAIARDIIAFLKSNM